MKAIGLPPSDPRVRQMNEAQWLWCFLNIQKDLEEEEKTWKTRLDYLGWYVDAEKAKSVAEYEAQQENKTNNNKQYIDDDGPSVDVRGNTAYIKHGVYQNTEFELESKAAALGYDPASGKTPQEFLDEYYNKKEDREIDIMNDDFDSLINSGIFKPIANDNTKGNKYESESDFIARAFAFEQTAHDSFEPIRQQNALNEDVTNVVPEEKLGLINNLLEGDFGPQPQIASHKQEIPESEREKFLRALAERGLTEADLDIIE